MQNVKTIPKNFWNIKITINQEFVAGSVIQATGTVEFKDGLRLHEPGDCT